MDYSKTAAELLEVLQVLYRTKPNKEINEATQGGGFILNYIACQGEEVLPGEICQEMNVSAARVAKVLNNLESKGYITRQIDTSDRRQILVKITEEGRKNAGHNCEIAINVISKRLALLGEHDAKEYVRITKRMAELYSQLEGEG